MNKRDIIIKVHPGNKYCVQIDMKNAKTGELYKIYKSEADSKVFIFKEKLIKKGYKEKDLDKLLELKQDSDDFENSMNEAGASL